jgi:hypothetical protein
MRKKKVTNESMMKDMHSLIRWLAVSGLGFLVGVGAGRGGSFFQPQMETSAWVRARGKARRAARGNLRPQPPCGSPVAEGGVVDFERGHGG